jgi:hypothetical protein
VISETPECRHPQQNQKSPPSQATVIQITLVSGFLGARGAALWQGKSVLELAWSQDFSPKAYLPTGFMNFSKNALHALWNAKLHF